jgi:WD40 repeat protein
VIDQHEELVTLCTSREERGRFAAAIAQLAASADLPIRVIATLRDDHLAQLEALPALRPLLPPALVRLGNPQRDALVRIIVEPARRAGYALSDPELADDMIAAVVDHPGALALVSFTALRLWELRDRRFHQLTRSAYEAMGGIGGALGRHAEATLGRLATDEQRVARAIFRHLVTADGVRARLASTELRQRLARPRAGAVLDKLIAARLIATSEVDGEAQVEIIHDALLDAWPRLQRWMREDVDGARMRDQLRTAARQWSDRARPRGLLWRDDALADVERWLRRGKPIVLSDLEVAFVDASRRLARHAAWIRRGVALVVMGFVAALAVFRYGALQTELAEQAAEVRLTQAYVERGRDAALEGKSTEALIYLTEAARRGDDSAMVRFILARTAQPLQGELGRLTSLGGRMWWAMFSRDGQRIVTTDDEGARIWDARTLRLKASLLHGGIVYHAAYTSDGTRILTAGADGHVKVWDATTGEPTASLSNPHVGTAVSYMLLAVSPHGGQVAAIDVTGQIVCVWDLRTGALVTELLDDRRAQKLPSLEFSSDGRWLATSAGDEVRVFDTQTWRRVRTIPGPEVSTLSFDPTSSQLATGTWRGDVSIWDVPSGARVAHLRESGDKIQHVAFSPDGTFVVAAVSDGTDRIWNARTAELKLELKNHHSAAVWAEFDPSSRLVISADNDGAVVISDVALGIAVSTLEGPHRLVRAVHFDPISPRVIGASWDGTARVWDAKRSYLRWGTPPIGQDCGSSVRPEPDRRFVAIACAGHGTQVWDTSDPADARLVAELPSPTAVGGDFLSPHPAVDAAGDRAAIATGSTVTIYELPGGRVVGAVHHATAITTVAFAMTGRDLVTGSVDGSLRITRAGGEELALPRLRFAVDVAGFLADGRVVAADAGKKLGVYAATGGLRLAELDLPARAAAFRSSQDGRRLVTIPGTGDWHPLALYDLEHLALIAQLDAHKALVLSAKFVKEDREILTAGTDGTARLWDAATGRLRKTYLRSSPYLSDAALDPSGAMVVTAGGDGVLRFWDASSARMIWTLRTHGVRLSGVHFEGTDIVTRGFAGELARWKLSNLPSSPDLVRAVDRIARCLPLRFDDETGGLVEQEPRCDN